MKKFYTMAFMLMLFSLQTFAQINKARSLSAIEQRRCATAELLQKFNAEHPGAETTTQFESWMSQKIAEAKANPSAHKITPGVTLPVIFHIIHNNEAVGVGRNVSQAAIIQQILQINKDYANLSNSPYAVAEDMGIRFGLAQNDPSGNPLPEPGIDRINRSDKGWSAPPYTVGYASASNYLTTVIKPNSIWDPERYLNIWVSQWEAGILGIATFPGSSTLAGLDNSETNSTAGVTISYITVGSVFKPFGTCTDPYGKGKTLTHELGHFFGLRHIWGDQDCGNDFCGDTPVHFEDNSGEPVHPKPNSCGTPDEMFENYMDYSDDIITNTFTVNQGDRMEAVFANSPRRAGLATSTAGVVLVTASNNLAFADCDGAMTVNENSGMTACPRFRDISLELNVEDKATAAATITITTGGTAVNGVDYQLLTPTVSFAAGDNFKPVNIRIFDDAIARGDKTIIVGFSIDGGGGLTAGTTGQTITITKIEDDAIKAINVTTPNTQLLAENFGTVANNGNVPVGWASGTFAAGPNTFTVNSQFGAATGFSAADGRMLHISNGSNPDRTSEIAANTYTFTSATDAAAITKAVNTVGYKNIKISFDYACSGVGSDFGYLRYSTTAQTSGLLAVYNTLGNLVGFQGRTAKTNVVVPLPDAVANQPNVWICFEWQNDAAGGSNPPFTIDNVIITGEAAGVETVLNQSVLQSHPAGQTEQYVSSTNNIIATITNPSVDLGCLTASISSAGTGLTTLNTTGGVYQRSNKVIKLTPTVANPTATYQATFYFTTAELAAWSADVPNLKLMKVQDGVSLGTTLNAGNSVVVATTVDDQRIAKGYASFTASFTGGFSQFFLVSPLTALPVLDLNFTAKAGQTNIQLNWSTNSELNNKGFAIERSIDGVNYDKIAWVDGAGSSSNLKHYTYTDNFVQPDVLYYYRLHQTDFDGKSFLSDVRQAKIKGLGISVTLSPNPASDKVKIFVAGSAGTSDVKLYNAEGQLVRSWKKMNLASPAMLDISGLAKGMYIFNIITGAETAVEKLIIK